MCRKYSGVVFARELFGIKAVFIAHAKNTRSIFRVMQSFPRQFIAKEVRAIGLKSFNEAGLYFRGIGITVEVFQKLIKQGRFHTTFICHCSVQSFAQWGTVLRSHTLRPSWWEPRAIKGSVFKGWSRIIALHCLSLKALSAIGTLISSFT